MPHSPRIAARAATILFAAALAWTGRAEAATPIPPFPEDRVAVAGTADTFGPLREHLAAFSSDVGASYHVCVVAPQRLNWPAAAE